MPAKPFSSDPRRNGAAPLVSACRPRDVLDAALGKTGALLQHLFVGCVDYGGVSWGEAVGEFEGGFSGDADEILKEAALERVEVHSRAVLAGIEGRDSFSRRWAADSLLARFCYLVCRLAKPEVVVETGVAYGVSSAFILAAMEENGRGALHSVDLPPIKRGAGRFRGTAIPTEAKPRWTLHRGSSRRMLPNLARELGEIDFFLHDSLHTERNMRFEFDEIWPALRSGGVLLADDVERNTAFGELREREPSLWRVVKDREKHPLHGNAAPVTFGIVVK